MRKEGMLIGKQRWWILMLVVGLVLAACNGRNTILETATITEGAVRQQADETLQPTPSATVTMPPFTIEVLSDPDGAEVWLDGEKVGKTPVTVVVTGGGKHRLELNAENYMDVVYEFDKPPINEPLTIRMMYDFKKIFILWGADIRSKILGERITADLNLIEDWQDGFLVVRDLAHPENVIKIAEFKWGNELQPEEIPDHLAFSPDGERVAYATTENPGPGCGWSSNKLWVTTLERPEKRNLVLHLADGYIYTCGQEYGFSPNSAWLWVKWIERGTSGYPPPPRHVELILFNLTPDTTPRETIRFNSGYSSKIFWSQDSQWFADYAKSGELLIYHWEEGVWQQVPLGIAAMPGGWWPDNRHLFITEKSGEDGSRFGVLDVVSGDVEWLRDFEREVWIGDRIVWDSTEQRYIVTITSDIVEEGETERKTQAYVGGARMDELLRVSTDDVYLVFYWLPDNRRIAIWQIIEEGYEDYPIMRILNVPEPGKFEVADK